MLQRRAAAKTKRSGETVLDLVNWIEWTAVRNQYLILPKLQLGVNTLFREFLSKVVYGESSGGDLVSIHLYSVFESHPLNYLGQELIAFELVPLLFRDFC